MPISSCLPNASTLSGEGGMKITDIQVTKHTIALDALLSELGYAAAQGIHRVHHPGHDR